MSKYKVIAICGKSAAGKDTLLQAMLNVLGNEVHEIISHTTRPPREGEVEGKNYYFTTIVEFSVINAITFSCNNTVFTSSALLFS